MLADPAKIPIVIHPDHNSLARKVAERIAEVVRAKP
jgi:hypothetical protein